MCWLRHQLVCNSTSGRLAVSLSTSIAVEFGDLLFRRIPDFVMVDGLEAAIRADERQEWLNAGRVGCRNNVCFE